MGRRWRIFYWVMPCQAESCRVTLAAGETRTVAFELGPEELQFWSTPARGWVQEPTVFDVWVGSDSMASLHTSFEVMP